MNLLEIGNEWANEQIISIKIYKQVNNWINKK